MDSQGLQATITEPTNIQASPTQRPAYETPRITVMEEADVLKTFQFTSAAPTWWLM